MLRKWRYDKNRVYGMTRIELCGKLKFSGKEMQLCFREGAGKKNKHCKKVGNRENDRYRGMKTTMNLSTTNTKSQEGRKRHTMNKKEKLNH